jgi:predicted helicase
MQKIINSCIIKHYESGENIFDLLLTKIQEFYDTAAHNMKELKQKESKKIKGDYFEELCKLYLKTKYGFVNGFVNVWLLEEVPEQILKKLGLKRKDYGIDIICETKTGFVAVQAKYRKIGRAKKNVITWNMLSTFYALCLKTGPYELRIVMTNADYITSMGQKTSKDKSICIGTWKNIKLDTWLKMAGISTSPSQISQGPSKEELRELRLKYY